VPLFVAVIQRCHTLAKLVVLRLFFFLRSAQEQSPWLKKTKFQLYKPYFSTIFSRKTTKIHAQFMLPKNNMGPFHALQVDVYKKKGGGQVSAAIRLQPLCITGAVGLPSPPAVSEKNPSCLSALLLSLGCRHHRISVNTKGLSSDYIIKKLNKNKKIQIFIFFQGGYNKIQNEKGRALR
jgi:hypothetical protein